MAVAFSWFPKDTPNFDLESIALRGLFNNPPPTNLIAPGNPLSYYVWLKDYRDILTLQVGYSIDPYSGAFHVSPYAVQYPGYTPVPVPIPQGYIYIPGDAKSVLSVYNNNSTSASISFTGLFRLSALEQNLAALLNSISGHGLHWAAWVWAEIGYTINYQGQAQVSFAGSSVPNQTDYIDGYYSDSYDVLNNYLGFNAFLATPYGAWAPKDNR